MHAWVFRNRHRLRLIYGPSEPTFPPPRPGGPDGDSKSDRRGGERSGRVLRLAKDVELVPMPRRVG